MYLATAVARYSSHLAAAIKVGRRPAARNPGGSAAHRPQSRWRFEILDPTGEWSRRCPGFMQKMTDNNIDVRSKPVNVDKHGLYFYIYATSVVLSRLLSRLLSLPVTGL